jgi:hypothetical protein
MVKYLRRAGKSRRKHEVTTARLSFVPVVDKVIRAGNAFGQSISTIDLDTAWYWSWSPVYPPCTPVRASHLGALPTSPLSPVLEGRGAAVGRRSGNTWLCYLDRHWT